MTRVLTVLVIMMLVVGVYALRTNDAAGLMVDDAYYVMLARALADGEGYRLVNSGTTEMVPLYPPGFPLILSLAFLLGPGFPANVWLLKAASILAMTGVGFMTLVYVRRRDLDWPLAACIAIAVSVLPAFVFLATSTVMSECVFAFFQLATVLLLERNADGPNERRSVWLAAFGGGTAAFAVLVRSAGIGLLVAGALFLLKEHRFRHALVFGAVSVAMLLPWATYARVHAPTAEERYTHGGSIVYSYGEQVWMRWAGDPASGSATLRDMPARVATNIVDVFGRDMIGIFAPTLLRGASESGEEIVSLGGAAGLTQGSMGNAPATMAISLLFSAMVLTGFAQAIRSRVTIAEILVPIALAIIVLWPFWTFRFVVPLAPFLFLYFVRGVQTIAAWARHALDHDHEGGFDLARVVLLAIIGLSVLDHAAYLYMVRQAGSTSVSWLQQARETDAALEWMRGNLEPGVVATTNPGLVFLRTGQRTISFDRIHSGWQGWRDRGVRYIACLLVVELPPDAAREVKVLYKSAGGFWIVEI